MQLFLIHLDWDYDGVEFVIWAAESTELAKERCFKKYNAQIQSIEHLGMSKNNKSGMLHEFIHYG